MLAEQALWELAAVILRETDYRLTGELLCLSVGRIDIRNYATLFDGQYYATGNDYAAMLVKSNEGFVNELRQSYYESKKPSGSYTFPVADGDLGAAL